MRFALVLLLIAAAAPVHAQHTKLRVALTGIHAAMRIQDAAVTCNRLAAGGHEEFLPWQSCKSVVLYSLGMVGAQVGTDLLLHHFHHDKLAVIGDAAFSVPVGVATIHNITSGGSVPAPVTLPVPVPVKVNN